MSGTSNRFSHNRHFSPWWTTITLILLTAFCHLNKQRLFICVILPAVQNILIHFVFLMFNPLYSFCHGCHFHTTKIPHHGQTPCVCRMAIYLLYLAHTLIQSNRYCLICVCALWQSKASHEPQKHITVMNSILFICSLITLGMVIMCLCPWGSVEYMPPFRTGPLPDYSGVWVCVGGPCGVACQNIDPPSCQGSRHLSISLWLRLGKHTCSSNLMDQGSTRRRAVV